MSSGLTFVYAQLGPDVGESEFVEWHDGHSAALLTIPGFIDSIRYRAVDEKEPKWLGVYNLKSPAVLASAEAKAVVENPTAQDKAVVPRIQSLNRRIYDLITTVEGDPTAVYPSPFALVVTFRVQPELEAEFNSWYNMEHIPLLATVAGFKRARRFKLLDSAELARQPASTAPVHNYLALYDVDRADYTQLPDFSAAMQTALSVKMVSRAEGAEMRFFGLDKYCKL